MQTHRLFAISNLTDLTGTVHWLSVLFPLFSNNSVTVKTIEHFPNHGLLE
jgi:hypothetical protein